VLVVHLEQQVQHALVDAGEDCEAMTIVLGKIRHAEGSRGQSSE